MQNPASIESLSMKTTSFRGCRFGVTAILAMTCALTAMRTPAASYEWRFDSGNLTGSLGNGVLAFRDAATPGLTTFGTTDGTTVPHINGTPANFMHVPILPDQANGYHLTFNDTIANGGGLYVNQYTFIFDVLRPTPIGDYAAFFNTNPDNPDGNDADFYLADDGSIGIGSGGYSAPGTIAEDTWYRIAFVADLAAGSLTFYVNGTAVKQNTSGIGVDGRWALFSSADPGVDVLLFNEGDTSGNYTGEWYVNAIAFVDQSLSASELLALGGPNAAGILPVPEPSVLSLIGLGLLGLFGARFQHRQLRGS